MVESFFSNYAVAGNEINLEKFPSRAQRKYFMEFSLRRNKEISLLSFKEFPQQRHECLCLHFKADSRERIIELGGEREACITADRSAGRRRR